MNRIVGFVGVIGAGKDHLADLTITLGDSIGEKWQKVSFADPLRKMAYEILGIDPSKIDYEQMKRTLINAAYGDVLITFREFLQRLGSTMRDIDKDFWVNLWANNLPNCNVVVSDCRYPNELKKILDMGGQVMFTNYISNRYNKNDPHESERMAQWFVNQGYIDGAFLYKEDLDDYLEAI